MSKFHRNRRLVLSDASTLRKDKSMKLSKLRHRNHKRFFQIERGCRQERMEFETGKSAKTLIVGRSQKTNRIFRT